MRYMEKTDESLQDREGYIHAVLAAGQTGRERVVP